MIAIYVIGGTLWEMESVAEFNVDMTPVFAR